MFVGRSATGEAWQDIMMACSSKASVVCDKASDSAGQRCGSDVAFPFFISFYVLCSFLVRRSSHRPICRQKSDLQISPTCLGGQKFLSAGVPGRFVANNPTNRPVWIALKPARSSYSRNLVCANDLKFSTVSKCGLYSLLSSAVIQSRIT